MNRCEQRFGPIRLVPVVGSIVVIVEVRPPRRMNVRYFETIVCYCVSFKRFAHSAGPGAVESGYVVVRVEAALAMAGSAVVAAAAKLEYVAVHTSLPKSPQSLQGTRDETTCQ